MFFDTSICLRSSGKCTTDWGLDSGWCSCWNVFTGFSWVKWFKLSGAELSLVTSLMVIWNNRKNIVKIPIEDRYCCLVDTEVLRLIICNFFKSQYCLLSLSIFPLARGGAFKCYSPLSPQRAIHLKLSRVLFKVIHMSYLRDGIKFYSFYIPIVVAKLGRCWVLTDAGLPAVCPWSASASHMGKILQLGMGNLKTNFYHKQ